ncbi:MAG: hypothetical protein WAW61_05870 [Methylococcaceae bacterium]
MDNFGFITYRFIVAHLAPGILALYPLYVLSTPIKTLVDSMLSNSYSWGIAFTLFVISLVVGLLIDGLCFISLDYMVEMIRIIIFKQATAKRQPNSKEDFEFIDAIYNRHFAWQQLYVGVAFVCLATFLIELFCEGFIGFPGSWFLLLFFVAFMVASAKSEAMNELMISGKWGTI